MRTIRNIAISFVVAFVVAFLFSFVATVLDPRGDLSKMAGTFGMAAAAFTLVILTALSGNRAVSHVPDAERNRMLAEAPPAGCGVVYVYREGFVGRAVGFDVFLDQAMVAQLKSPRFTRLVVPQGRHVLASGTKQAGEKEAKPGVPVVVTVAAGETVVFSLKLKRQMLTTSVDVVREADVAGVVAKLARVTMVAPQTSVGVA